EQPRRQPTPVDNTVATETVLPLTSILNRLDSALNSLDRGPVGSRPIRAGPVSGGSRRGVWEGSPSHVQPSDGSDFELPPILRQRRRRPPLSRGGVRAVDPPPSDIEPEP